MLTFAGICGKVKVQTDVIPDGKTALAVGGKHHGSYSIKADRLGSILLNVALSYFIGNCVFYL